LEDLTKKFETLLEQSIIFQENLPSDLEQKISCIENQAKLVLTENKVLNNELKLKEKQLSSLQILHTNIIGRFSKRVIICQTDRIRMLNQIDILKNSKEEIIEIYNNLSHEHSRCVKFNDHLLEIANLNQQIADMTTKFKKEIHEMALKIKV
jgi:hypothetical protein